jgi:hypothetical protein
MSEPKDSEEIIKMQSIVNRLKDRLKEVDSIIDRITNVDEKSGFVFDPKPGDYVEGECLFCTTKVTNEDKEATDEATDGYQDPMCKLCLVRYLNTKCSCCNEYSNDNDVSPCIKCHKFYCECCNGTGDNLCDACEMGRCNVCEAILLENFDLEDEYLVKTCSKCRKD